MSCKLARFQNNPCEQFVTNWGNFLSFLESHVPLLDSISIGVLLLLVYFISGELYTYVGGWVNVLFPPEHFRPFLVELGFKFDAAERPAQAEAVQGMIYLTHALTECNDGERDQLAPRVRALLPHCQCLERARFPFLLKRYLWNRR